MKIVFLRQAHRFIKKANKGLKEKLKQEIINIQSNPYEGKPLKGKLKGVYSHKCVYKQTHYRIAYHIENNIIIISIASRENFYRDLTN